MGEEIKSINRNYNTLFIDNENKQEELDNRIRDAINTRDWYTMTKLLEENPNMKLLISEDNLIYLLEKYTLENTESQREEILEQLSQNAMVEKINIANDFGFNVTLKDKTILIAIKATKQIPILMKDDKILTEERYGVCHQAAKGYISGFGKSKLVTGYLCGLSDKTRFLHSWIEFENDTIEWVFDYTMNALINKDAYYKINHVTIVNEISEEEIYKDKRRKFQDSLKFVINGEEHEFDDKTYLTCDKEIKREFKQKNPAIYSEIFEEER